jgi:phosphoribosyl-AMP cyclohydrolase / phosphoribosyl-ATP pyrophosphohydrolase
MSDEGFPIRIADDLARVDFSRAGGTVTVVAQDARTGRVLMVAHADRTAMEQTLRTGEMHYLSRTRGLWHKGATSGNVQRVRALVADCDADAVLALVEPAGPACHTGATACFPIDEPQYSGLAELDATIAERAMSSSPPESSYTRRLLDDRNLRLKKLGEECAELVTACADGDRERAVEEAADVVYHTLVALQSVGARLADVERALVRRRRPARKEVDEVP